MRGGKTVGLDDAGIADEGGTDPSSWMGRIGRTSERSSATAHHPEPGGTGTLPYLSVDLVEQRVAKHWATVALEPALIEDTRRIVSDELE